MNTFTTTTTEPHTTNTRRGKIARLPRTIRDTLNHRLSEGEFARPILDWLNDQPEVISVLAEHFDSRPITEQNLSHWRQGGYIDWEQKELLRDSLTTLAEDLDDLTPGENGQKSSIADRFAQLQALALGRLLMAAMAEPASDRREQRILALVRSLNSVRRCDHDFERVKLQRQRQQQAHVGKFIYLPDNEADARESARKHALLQECLRQEFEKTATHRTATAHASSPSPSIPSTNPGNTVNPSQSNPIQPNQSSEKPTAPAEGNNPTQPNPRDADDSHGKRQSNSIQPTPTSKTQPLPRQKARPADPLSQTRGDSQPSTLNSQPSPTPSGTRTTVTHVVNFPGYAPIPVTQR